MNRITLLPCSEYEPKLITEAVAKVFSATGLDDKLDFNSKKVFLKVNLLGAYPPEKAVTTHPTIVEAVANALKMRGAEVYIGDSPGGFPKPVYMEQVFKISGISEVAAKTNSTLVNLSAQKTVKKNLKSRFVKELHLPQIIFEMDYLFTLPKIKTHTLTFMTGAVKNLFGIIPGFYKSEIHKLATRSEELSEFVVDLYELIPPTFTIADAITIMEGEGPSGGQPGQLGVILAGENAVEIDAAAAYLIGYEPEEVHTLRIAGNRGLGVIDTDKLLESCPQLAQYRRKFKLPRFSLTRQLTEQAAFLGGGVVKPKVTLDLCQLCQFCIESCPTEAISCQEKKIQFDYDECIRCLCCQELCPHQAIYLERSLLARGISFSYGCYQKIRKTFVG